MSEFGSRLDPNLYHFAPRPGVISPLEDRIVEVRKLLRTNMSIAEIGKQLGVTDKAVTRFVKRRNLCDLKARREFIARLKLTGQIEK
jgi:hypothetical protein